MKEEWRAVLGYEGFYEVSSAGKVRSLTRMRRGRQGCEQRHQGRVLRQNASLPYNVVGLSMRGVVKIRYVHRLVWEAFSGENIPKGMDINHKNCDKRDNHLDNLECVTRQENVKHAIANGKCPHLESGKHPNCKLTREVAEKIRDRIAAGEVQRRIAEDLGVSYESVSAIHLRKIWK